MTLASATLAMQTGDDEPEELAAAVRSPTDAPVQGEHADDERRATMNASAANRPPGPGAVRRRHARLRWLRRRSSARGSAPASGSGVRLGAGCGSGLTLDELEEDDGDVVLAALRVRGGDERVAPPPRVALGASRIAAAISSVGEHVREAVRAEEEEVAELGGRP